VKIVNNHICAYLSLQCMVNRGHDVLATTIVQSTKPKMQIRRNPICRLLWYGQNSSESIVHLGYC